MPVIPTIFHFSFYSRLVSDWDLFISHWISISLFSGISKRDPFPLRDSISQVWKAMWWCSNQAVKYNFLRNNIISLLNGRYMLTHNWSWFTLYPHIWKRKQKYKKDTISIFIFNASSCGIFTISFWSKGKDTFLKWGFCALIK